MNSNQVKLAISGICFLIVFFSGYWLSRTGKPFPMILITLHKLVALGAAVYLGVTIYQFHQVAPLSPIQLAAAVAAAVFFIATVATGGLLSAEKEMPVFVLRIHQIVPYLTVLASAATLYMLLFVSGTIAKS